MKVSLKIERNEVKVLKLESTYNIRDLGGFKTADGKTKKYSMFLRSDDTDELTESDIKTLKNYGVNTVIDMRDKAEVSGYPDKLNVPEIDNYHVDVKGNYAKPYEQDHKYFDYLLFFPIYYIFCLLLILIFALERFQFNLLSYI